MEDRLTKGEVVRWLVDPTTKKVRTRIDVEVIKIMGLWAEGMLFQAVLRALPVQQAGILVVGLVVFQAGRLLPG